MFRCSSKIVGRHIAVSCIVFDLRTGDNHFTPYIPRLGACLFRGDLTHAGSSYRTRNVRVHVYFAYANFRRPRSSKGDAAFGPRDELLPRDFERLRASSRWTRIETYIRENPEVGGCGIQSGSNSRRFCLTSLGHRRVSRKKTSHTPGPQEMVNQLIVEVNTVRGRGTA